MGVHVDNMPSRFLHSKDAATKLTPIERALKPVLQADCIGGSPKVIIPYQSLERYENDDGHAIPIIISLQYDFSYIRNQDRGLTLGVSPISKIDDDHKLNPFRPN